MRELAAAKRLPIPPEVEAELKAKGHAPRWVNDEGNRMHRFTVQDDYDRLKASIPCLWDRRRRSAHYGPPAREAKRVHARGSGEAPKRKRKRQKKRFSDPQMQPTRLARAPIRTRPPLNGMSPKNRRSAGPTRFWTAS
jgi:hypothetical protein